MELYEQTAAKLSEMLQNKECSAVELCQSVQGRIAAVEDKVGAYVTQCEDALAQAEAVDQARAAGETLHPLAGIPIGIKDNMCIQDAGRLCSAV